MAGFARQEVKQASMKRRRWVIIGIITLAVVAMISLMSGSRVPAYQGKTVYDWMFAQKSSAPESSPGSMAIAGSAIFASVVPGL